MVVRKIKLVVYVQTPQGSFKRTNQKLFEKDKASEDTGNLYSMQMVMAILTSMCVVEAVNFTNASTALIDRLYFNDGKGNFKKSAQVLPTMRFESNSTVKAADYDGDGDQDLFVGGARFYRVWFAGRTATF